MSEPARVDRETSPPSSHPQRNQLEHFIRGGLPPAECSAIVRHLLTGCPSCVAVTGRYWNLGERPRALVILLEEALAMEALGRHERASVF